MYSSHGGCSVLEVGGEARLRIDRQPVGCLVLLCRLFHLHERGGLALHGHGTRHCRQGGAQQVLPPLFVSDRTGLVHTSWCRRSSGFSVPDHHHHAQIQRPGLVLSEHVPESNDRRGSSAAGLPCRSAFRHRDGADRGSVRILYAVSGIYVGPLRLSGLVAMDQPCCLSHVQLEELYGDRICG